MLQQSLLGMSSVTALKAHFIRDISTQESALHVRDHVCKDDCPRLSNLNLMRKVIRAHRKHFNLFATEQCRAIQSAILSKKIQYVSVTYCESSSYGTYTDLFTSRLENESCVSFVNWLVAAHQCSSLSLSLESFRHPVAMQYPKSVGQIDS